MRDPAELSISAHARRRSAQRNLRPSDINYVYTHGRIYRTGNALFVYLARRDIPVRDLRDSRLCRLEGTVLVLDPTSGVRLTTVYRNRAHGSRDIKRKSKRAFDL